MAIDYLRIYDGIKYQKDPVAALEKAHPPAERDENAPKETSAKPAVTPVEADKVSREEVISYQQLIREKIREVVARRYHVSSLEGDVYLEFVIDGLGNVLDFRIDRLKSSPGRLTDIVASSIKEASPFPPPPEGIRKDRVSFTIIISFRPR
jgi:TonB family protein